MKASLPTREPQQVQKWQDEKVYERMVERRKQKPMFVFHDGPPYANGGIHLGTSLNKILKDIVVKYKNMAGFHTEFIPGWDCHGLPIELGVEKQLQEQKKDKSKLSQVEIRKLCREYANTYIEKQRNQFKRLGVLAQWDSPYLTMSDDYVANIIRELGRISKAGNLYKGNKPVYWCVHCATALADAEIEYSDRASPSIYVKFFLQDLSLKKIPEISQIKKPTALVIWTTTPWTLPANLAIALHPELEYAAIDTGSEILIVAEGLREKFLLETNLNSKTIALLKAQNLERLYTNHPFMKRTSLVILGEHVTLETGTGAVHTAPGHGMDDYKLGQKYGLDILSPVDAHGKFTEEVPDYQGKSVFDSNQTIIDQLQKSGHLIKAGQVQHSYPHCWRCRKPVIFRATSQWFIGMEKTHLRKRAIEEIHQVRWIPEWGINRILGMIENRPDWCISRQRLWGVPIPVFYCKKCHGVIQSQETLNFVADIVEKNSSDAWYEWPIEKLLKPGAKCTCGETNPQNFEKETDILDVWFDSGISHAAVLASLKNKNKVQWPADLYLEGSDQHRGWFQTSLLTAVESRGQAPYKQVLTHGFVNDKEGKKMSKSKGNVTDPMDFSNQFGAEILRLWVVIEDYRNDVNFSMETIDRISESYRKIRNTFRYILGNLYDFTPPKSFDMVEFCDLDQWALDRTGRLLEKLYEAYESYEFHLAYHALVNFCAVDLSALYFDILKNRLYTYPQNSKERRSAQTTLYKIGTALASGLAPILSFTAEEVWKFLKHSDTVFESNFPSLDPFWQSTPQRTEAADRIEKALQFRELVNKALEASRVAKTIGHPLEARVELTVPKEELVVLQNVREDLRSLFIVSQFDYKEGDAVHVMVHPAQGQKCARCWMYTNEVGTHKQHPQLCTRCADAMG